jgi:hypothetical protein
MCSIGSCLETATPQARSIAVAAICISTDQSSQSWPFSPDLAILPFTSAPVSWRPSAQNKNNILFIFIFISFLNKRGYAHTHPYYAGARARFCDKKNSSRDHQPFHPVSLIPRPKHKRPTK